MMTAQDVLNAIEAAGGSVAVAGDKLKFRAPVPLPADVMALAREHKPELLALLSENTHSDLKGLTEEFNRTGRIRIDSWSGSVAWLVLDYAVAIDISVGAVYDAKSWPDFLRLDPAHQFQVHEFLCGLGGGQFDHTEESENAIEELKVSDERGTVKRSREIEQGLATAFGQLHGWALSPTRFTLTQLAQQSNQRRHRYVDDPNGVMDHPYYYRETQRPYRPAGLAAHLYNWPYCGPHVEFYCLKIGLRYESIIDFPSWWVPGQTTLILYTPRPVQAKR